MPDREFLLNLNSDLEQLRKQLNQAIIALSRARRDLTLAKHQTEHNILFALPNGEKDLGSNQAARDRELALLLASDADYQAAVEAHDDALLRKLEAEIEVKAIEMQLKIYLATGGD